MGRAASNDAPADPKAIMAAKRAAYREEQLLPDVKWACFEEQRKHEDFAAVRRQRGITRLDGTHRSPHRSSSPRNKLLYKRRTRSPTKR